MLIPSYLKNYSADYIEKNGESEITIVDSEGGRLFEVWYYGTPLNIDGYEYPLYVGTEFSVSKFVARSVKTGEEILLFDGVAHGYDAMFCNSYSQEQIEQRPLRKLEFSPVELKIWCGYSIDYDDEKDIYNFDENGNVILLNGSTIAWEQLKTDGIDAIAIYYKNSKGKWIQFAEEELA